MLRKAGSEICSFNQWDEVMESTLAISISEFRPGLQPITIDLKRVKGNRSKGGLLNPISRSIIRRGTAGEAGGYSDCYGVKP